MCPWTMWIRRYRPSEGVDLVTEGVLTLNRVVQLLRRYAKNETVSETFFEELDKNNGASMVAKILIEDCTEVHLYVGKAINSAYQNLYDTLLQDVRLDVSTEIDTLESMLRQDGLTNDFEEDFGSRAKPE